MNLIDFIIVLESIAQFTDKYFIIANFMESMFINLIVLFIIILRLVANFIEYLYYCIVIDCLINLVSFNVEISY